jgi:hypothetical protein
VKQEATRSQAQAGVQHALLANMPVAQHLQARVPCTVCTVTQANSRVLQNQSTTLRAAIVILVRKFVTVLMLLLRFVYDLSLYLTICYL